MPTYILLHFALLSTPLLCGSLFGSVNPSSFCHVEKSLCALSTSNDQYNLHCIVYLPIYYSYYDNAVVTYQGIEPHETIVSI